MTFFKLKNNVSRNASVKNSREVSEVDSQFGTKHMAFLKGFCYQIFGGVWGLSGAELHGSDASSEVSVIENGLCLDNSEIDDDIVSVRSGQSSASVRGR